MAFPRLRQVNHPDMSELLVHFTSRSRPVQCLPEDIAAMSARDRLDSILSERTIRATNTYYAPFVPVVCFTESTLEGLEFMIRQQGFAPWGIVFHKQVVFDVGGGPVFHVRGDEWEERKNVSSKLRSRFIMFQPGQAEWTEEREWRIPYENDAPGFTFEPESVEAVIVGDPAWPAEETPDDLAALLGPTTSQMFHAIPTWFRDYPKWIWDGEQLSRAA